MPLTTADVIALKNFLDQTITGSQGPSRVPGTATLSPDAQAVVNALTPAELAALKSVYDKAVARGANTADLKRYGPIF